MLAAVLEGLAAAGSRNAVVALKPMLIVPPEPNWGPGSRNAVVALKPPRSPERDPGVFSKQERRGGIETSACFPASSRRQRTKQERRGGIETWWAAKILLTEVWEAGTPWWH